MTKKAIATSLRVTAIKARTQEFVLPEHGRHRVGPAAGVNKSPGGVDEPADAQG